MKKKVVLYSILSFLIISVFGCKKSDSIDDVKEQNALVVYSNIRLYGVDHKETDGCYFSTKTGRVYSTSELTEGGSDIDIVYIGWDGIEIFMSPDRDNSLVHWGLDAIPNATATKFIGYVDGSDINFTVNMFDSMTDSTPLNNLKIVHDDNAYSGDVPGIVLFQNALGQKGAIKVTKISWGARGYIEFDIKMQKYAQ